VVSMYYIYRDRNPVNPNLHISTRAKSSDNEPVKDIYHAMDLNECKCRWVE
jgi:hypothetical protein